MCRDKLKTLIGFLLLRSLSKHYRSIGAENDTPADFSKRKKRLSSCRMWYSCGQKWLDVWGGTEVILTTEPNLCAEGVRPGREITGKREQLISRDCSLVGI